MKTRHALSGLCAALALAVGGCVGTGQTVEELTLSESSRAAEKCLVRGAAYEKKMQWDEALGEYRKAERELPEEPRVNMGLGHCYFQKRIYDTAIEHLDKVIRDEPRKVRAYELKVQCLFGQEKHEETAALCNRCQQKFPSEPCFYAWEGIALEQLDRPAEAIERYRQVLKLSLDYDFLPKVRYRLGLLYLQQGAFQKCLLEWQEFYKTKPTPEMAKKIQVVEQLIALDESRNL